MEQAAGQQSWFVETIKGAGLGLSAGIVAWIVRGGALFAGLMASLPAWRHFDLVPILSMNKHEKEAWSRRVKEVSTMEAHEHQSIDQIMENASPEVLDSTMTAASETNAAETDPHTTSS